MLTEIYKSEIVLSMTKKLWLRSEKKEMERRTPLTPDDAKSLAIPRTPKQSGLFGVTDILMDFSPLL